MARHVSVTPELLQQAWRGRRRADWPSTFEACMADELLRRLVRSEAVRLALRASSQRAVRQAGQPRQHATPLPARLRAPAPRDLKRAAAGDAGDD